MPAISIAAVSCVLTTGCRSQWSSHHSYGLQYAPRGRDCGIKHYEKPPDDEYVVLGIVEAGMSAHFTKGRASLSKVLPLLKTEACRLGANAILDIETKYSVRQDYTEIHVKAKGAVVSRTLMIPSSGDKKTFRTAWLSLSKAAKNLPECIITPTSIVVHTDVGADAVRVEPLDPDEIQDQTLQCIREKLKELSLPEKFWFHSFLLVIHPGDPDAKPAVKQEPRDAEPAETEPPKPEDDSHDAADEESDGQQDQKDE